MAGAEPMSDRNASGNGTESGVSVVIPTYCREKVLIDTIALVLALDEPPTEVLVVDQTPVHDAETEASLRTWEMSGRVRWLRVPRPSIPGAMNLGLREATGPVVLFLDDDVIPWKGLITAHRANYEEPETFAVAGMVLQPGEEPGQDLSARDVGGGIRKDLGFEFNSTGRTPVWNVIAANMSVRKTAALQSGGFDERFVGVSYRFETEFCRRLWRAGGTVIFEPRAAVGHLKAPAGGTRVHGAHLTSSGPEHSVGDYYFAMLEAQGLERWTYVAARLSRAAITKFHLTHPWWIPTKLLGESRGLCLAWRLHQERRERQ
jgi:GT2 family glycosyltransferase